MTMLAAATATIFAFGAGAEFTESGTSFENYSTNVLLTTADDFGGGGARFWYSAADPDEAPFVITNAVPALPSGVARPELFASSNNTASLMIETTDDKRLFRTAQSNTQDPAAFTQVEIPDEGIYLDTLVKFTAADSAFSSNLTDGDKIAISYVEHEADTDGDESYTNFVIRAGYVDGYETQTNYCAAVPEGFDKDAWHRLTVRTIADVGDGSAGFIVYLDQVALAYSTDVAAGESAYVEALSEGIKSKFYNSEVHALFPSVVRSGAYKTSISAVSFSGNGSVDDVVFTTTTPGFIEATESVVATINLGTGISGVTVSVSGTPVEPADSTANPLVFNLAPGTTDFTLAVTADAANGYTFDDATGITAENASYANGTVTISGGAPTLTLQAARNNVNYIDGDNNPTSCVSLATAIAGAKAGSTITIAYPINVADVEGGEFTTYTITGKDITIDLNGNTITWDDADAETSLFTIASSGSLKVIDSSVANTGVIAYAGVEGCVFYNSGDCYIGATSGDYGPTVQGTLTSKNKEPTIVRGKFDKVKNTASNTFKWVDSVAEGSELVESLGDYWIVAPQGGGDEDWVPDSSAIPADTSAETQYPALAGTALATADAKQLTDWAKANGVAFSDVKTSADSYVDAFLLNCAVADVDDEKDEFVVNISFDPVTGEPVVTAPTGKTYNGTFKVYGSDDLTTPKASWHEQTDGDTFFYGKLVP